MTRHTIIVDNSSIMCIYVCLYIIFICKYAPDNCLERTILILTFRQLYFQYLPGWAMKSPAFAVQVNKSLIMFFIG